MFVFSNLATSLDGKIATASRKPFFLGTPADRRRMQVLRRRCDVLLMGAGTLRAHRAFCGVRAAPPALQPANAILSASLEGISPDWPFFSDPRRTRLLLLTKPRALPAARRRLFERSCVIIPLARSAGPIARAIVSELGKRGYRSLLVEGGGELMWHFASENLIDQYNITLTPKIVGGAGSPTLVEGKGFAPEKILGLKLASCRRLGDELYLAYIRRLT